MPVYVYKCSSCEEICEKIHGMTEEMSDLCYSCDVGSLHKIPSHISVRQISNVGNVVRGFIQSTKEDNRKEKENLSNKEYKK